MAEASVEPKMSWFHYSAPYNQITHSVRIHDSFNPCPLSIPPHFNLGLAWGGVNEEKGFLPLHKILHDLCSKNKSPPPHNSWAAFKGRGEGESQHIVSLPPPTFRFGLQWKGGFVSNTSLLMKSKLAWRRRERWLLPSNTSHQFLSGRS